MGTGSVPSISLEKPLKPPHSKKPVVWRAVLRGCWLAMGLVDCYARVLCVSPGVLMDEVNSTKTSGFSRFRPGACRSALLISAAVML